MTIAALVALTLAMCILAAVYRSSMTKKNSIAAVSVAPVVEVAPHRTDYAARAAAYYLPDSPMSCSGPPTSKEVAPRTTAYAARAAAYYLPDSPLSCSTPPTRPPSTRPLPPYTNERLPPPSIGPGHDEREIVAAAFREADLNGDGRLDRTEFPHCEQSESTAAPSSRMR
jgi:hypothetical protein